MSVYTGNLNNIPSYPEQVEVCAAVIRPANPTMNPGYNPGTYAAVVSAAPAIDVKTPNDGGFNNPNFG